MLLPYAFGVRMYEEDGACHVWGQAVSLARGIDAGVEAVEATLQGSGTGRSDQAGGGHFRSDRG